MEQGTSRHTKMIEKYFDSIRVLEINEFVENIKNSNFEKIDFTEDIRDYSKSIDLEDYLTLRTYTGYEFKNINAILRDNWTYEVNGKLDGETKEKYEKLSEDIIDLINRFPSPKKNFITYRGTTIDEFKKYGIYNLNDLIFIKDRYIYEEGFTSTSLEEEQCYYGKEIIGNDFRNIKVKYLIAKDSEEGMPLNTDDFSYSKQLQEYILNSGALSKVIDVKIDDTTAELVVALIPKKIWDRPRLKIS